MSWTIERVRHRSVVDPATACWVWQGAKTPKGYAVARVGGQAVYVHRLVSEMVEGPLVPRQVVRHDCDRPSCVNPDHLRRGSQSDNIQDSIRRGRFPTGDRSPFAKLSGTTVQSIRRDRSAGQTIKSLVDKYQIHRSTVQAIVEMKTWRHLQKEL